MVHAFALEALFEFRIVRKMSRQDFDGNGSVEAGIPSAIDFAHAAGRPRETGFHTARVSCPRLRLIIRNHHGAITSQDTSKRSVRYSLASRFHVETVNWDLSAIYRIAAFASITAKGTEWASEHEFRHVALVPRNSGIQLEERKSVGKNIRYLPVLVRAGGRRIALAEIIIGSNQSAEEIRGRLKLLLAGKGCKIGDFEYPKITASAIPSLGPWISGGLDPLSAS